MWRVLRWPLLLTVVCLTIAALWPTFGLICLFPLLILWWVPIRPQVPLNLDYELQFLLDD